MKFMHGKELLGSCRHALVATALVLAGQGVLAQENDALSILKRMSDYMAAQQTLAIRFDSAIEVITPQLEKIQFTNSGQALLSRPNRLFAHRMGGYSDVALSFDGKQVSIYGRGRNVYAQFDGPASVDQLLDALHVGHGVALPGADLLLSNSYEALAEDVLEAKHIGRGVVGGRECEHLAFRNFDTDWQLWVETGDRPAPCKLVITSKTLNSAPQYTLLITGFRSGVTPNPGAFSFRPPAGATQIEPDALLHLDELPPGVPAGGGQ